jgi:hypothetical protein
LQRLDVVVELVDCFGKCRMCQQSAHRARRKQRDKLARRVSRGSMGARTNPAAMLPVVGLEIFTAIRQKERDAIATW